ncbi:unnamed protein product [Schistocephalus solidus]|uniref:Chromosome 9 open reading frame 50 n=1 Tax=Schistocephalus solidus TaxID=70667 RepID=A0A183TCL5_SCHSO|nr:unnamed protein product [Schistocephalus solidus]
MGDRMPPPVRRLFVLRPLNTPDRQLRSLVYSKEADVACERTVERIRQKFQFDLLRMSPLKKQTHPVSGATLSSEAVQTEWNWSVLSSKNQYVPGFYHPRSVAPGQSPSDTLPNARLVKLNRKQRTGCSPHQKQEKPVKIPLGRSRSTSLPSYQFRIRKTSFTEKKRETWSKGCSSDGKELACTKGTNKPVRLPQRRELDSRSHTVNLTSKENIPVFVGASRRRRSLLPRDQTIDTYFQRLLPYPLS